MNWLTNFVKPKLSSLVKRRKVPEKLWNNCVSCGNMIHHKDLNENLRVCMNCEYHFRMSAEDRIKLLFEDNKYKEIELDKTTDDPLNFSDKKKYKDRLKEYRNKTKRDDAFILIDGSIKDKQIIAGLMNFEFMGGSMGRAVGGAIVKGARIAVEKKLPYVVITSSGGARMQEGIISLMQMPRTIAAVDLLNSNQTPYIVILTEPTTGGVTASFAMLGDITIAEKGATIGFAGKRVIQDTIREELPIDFQKAEYLKEHGMVDIVSHRKDLKETLYKVLKHIS
ncbi:acetyl-CoA carboxylase, carboxyltransferase subunit beta [Pelagibacteraceae bacterium]|nr:acetyl-CoA carboxylase, carboxyltransferase subunit beta [Pelagibacteraceae bacterium]